MKPFFLIALVTCLAFIACGTPSPATTIPSDSIMKSGQSSPDSAKVDTTRN